MTVRGALFDQDGVLFDTESIFQRCWHEVGARMGMDVPDALPRSLIGCGRAVVPGLIRRFFPTCDAEAYVDAVVERAHEVMLAQTPALKPGVREILSRCRELGIRTAVATSSFRTLTEHNLASTGLAPFFDAIVTGPEVAHGKPAPDIFLLAASRLGVSPGDCLVFEDSYSGIQAAHAAGCRPVFVPDQLPPTPEVRRLGCVRLALRDAVGLLSES